MLINLTNHPLEQWSTSQLNAAELYGECIDMPFPAIDAEADEEYIDRLSDEYLHKIKEIAKREASEITVHLMGEMTFTLLLVTKLIKADIPCIASTSVRQSKEIGNGQKEITFKFVRFRNYIISPCK